MKHRKLIALLLVVMLLAAILTAGCGNKAPAPSGDDKGKVGEKSEPKKLKVAVLMASLQGAIYVARAYGVLEQAKAEGVETILLGAGGYDKLDVQVKQVEDMIAAKVDGIIIMPLSMDGSVPVIDKAVDKGIKIVEMGNQSNSKKVNARVGPDSREFGRMLARRIGTVLNGKGNVVMFNGPAGSNWATLETEGFKEVMTKEYPNIKILGERYTIYDVGVAFNTMNDYMQAFPNIDYVYTAYDAYAEGAARAVEAAGKKGKIKIGTVGMTAVTKKLLADGTLDYVVGAGPINDSRNAMKVMAKLLKGESVPPMTVAQPTNYYQQDAAKPDFSPVADIPPEGWSIPVK